MTNLSTGKRTDLTERRAQVEAALVEVIRDQAERAPNTIERLRKHFGTDLANRIVASASLQTKARKKFGEGVWWATEKSLQQATPWQVAQAKSAWFTDQRVFDLCCGIGGDSMALARRGDVVAVDLDPVLVEMVAANLYQVSTDYQMICHCEDVTEMDFGSDAAIHLDPDRRTPGGRKPVGRTTVPDHYQPSWSQVQRLLTRTRSAVIKLAPAATVCLPKTSPAHACWISLSRRVREQSLLAGEAVQRGMAAGGKSAMMIRDDGSAIQFAPSLDELEFPATYSDRPEAYLIDPDPAIRAAGLTSCFANAHGLKLIGAASGFLTSPSTASIDVASMSTTGEVIWQGAADDRKLRRELRNRNVYPEVIKVRGSDHDPQLLRRRYRQCGESPITLWIGRSGKRVYAAMTKSANSPSSQQT